MVEDVRDLSGVFFVRAVIPFRRVLHTSIQSTAGIHIQLPNCLVNSTEEYDRNITSMCFSKWVQSQMNDFFLCSHRFPPRAPRSSPFNTSVMYKKTVFVEFTDHLFNIAKPRPPWMGNINNTGCSL